MTHQRHGHWLVAVSLCGAVNVLPTQAADAATTVQVKFVDHYRYGRVKVGTNDVTRKLHGGEVTRYVAVTPDSELHNDSLVVESLRYERCGEGDIGYYYRPGHRYKVVVTHMGHCQLDSGETVPAPHAEVVKVS